jgi:hypothetical protein
MWDAPDGYSVGRIEDFTKSLVFCIDVGQPVHFFLLKILRI